MSHFVSAFNSRLFAQRLLLSALCLLLLLLLSSLSLSPLNEQSCVCVCGCVVGFGFFVVPHFYCPLCVVALFSALTCGKQITPKGVIFISEGNRSARKLRVLFCADETIVGFWLHLKRLQPTVCDVIYGTARFCVIAKSAQRKRPERILRTRNWGITVVYFTLKV